MEKLIIMALLYLIEGQPAHEVRSIELMHAIGSTNSASIRSALLFKLGMLLDKLNADEINAKEGSKE